MIARFIVPSLLDSTVVDDMLQPGSSSLDVLCMLVYTEPLLPLRTSQMIRMQLGENLHNYYDCAETEPARTVDHPGNCTGRNRT